MCVVSRLREMQIHNQVCSCNHMCSSTLRVVMGRNVTLNDGSGVEAEAGDMKIGLMLPAHGQNERSHNTYTYLQW